MSSKPWQASLDDALKDRPSCDGPPRIAVVGIGHELRGDDAAGLRLARALQPLVAGNERVLVIEAGSAPESICGRLRRYRPDLVLLVDAAQMRAEAGTVRWLSWRDATGLSASTHTLPIHILASYLIIELGCAVALLGIQPCDTGIGSSLTPPVRKAAVSTARALAEVLQQDTCPASGRPGH